MTVYTITRTSLTDRAEWLDLVQQGWVRPLADGVTLYEVEVDPAHVEAFDRALDADEAVLTVQSVALIISHVPEREEARVDEAPDPETFPTGKTERDADDT